MAGLSAAAFLALAAACAPQAPPQTLLAIATVESGLSPWVIHDNTAKREHSPGSLEEAVGLAKQLRAAGHNIDSGIMQVNSGNWTSLNVSLEDTFDRCINVRAGAQEYCSYDPSQCQPSVPALSKYNTGSAVRGVENGYVRKVISAYAANANQKAAENPMRAEGVSTTQAVPALPRDWGLFTPKLPDLIITAEAPAEQLSEPQADSPP